MEKVRNKKRPVIWQDVTPIKAPLRPIKSKNNIAKKISNKIRTTSSLTCKKIIKKIKSIAPKKLAVIILASVFVIVGVFFLYINLFQPSKVSNITKETKKTSNLLVVGSPKFQVLTPNGISIDKLAGRINPPNKTPVFVYIDKIAKTRIRVSEQPLPNDFKQDTAKQISQLAESNNANAKITADNIIVYIKNSADGPQSLIFNKSDLLITITSDGKLDNDHWIKYVTSLK